MFIVNLLIAVGWWAVAVEWKRLKHGNSLLYSVTAIEVTKPIGNGGWEKLQKGGVLTGLHFSASWFQRQRCQVLTIINHHEIFRGFDEFSSQWPHIQESLNPEIDKSTIFSNLTWPIGGRKAGNLGCYDNHLAGCFPQRQHFQGGRRKSSFTNKHGVWQPPSKPILIGKAPKRAICAVGLWYFRHVFLFSSSHSCQVSSNLRKFLVISSHVGVSRLALSGWQKSKLVRIFCSFDLG